VPHPLEHPYNWRTPTVFASLAALICVGVLAQSTVLGRLAVSGLLFGIRRGLGPFGG
jgi:hypothetical protein